jgi:Putative abortive phage resistance protein AbiGi, antitoxin
MGQYISDCFFHFVGHRDAKDHDHNYQTLKLILKSKRIGRCGEEASQHGITIRRDLAESLRSGKLIAPEIVCLADIPLKHLAIHVAKYGYFGIGLEKHHCIWHGARPVSYIPMRSDDFLGPIHGKSLLNDIETAYRAFRQYLLDPESTAQSMSRTIGKIESRAEAIHSLQDNIEMHFLAFLKAYNSELTDDHADNFYTEREWRCLIDIHFEFKHVAIVSVHEDFKERLSKDFPALSDRIDVMS